MSIRRSTRLQASVAYVDQILANTQKDEDTVSEDSSVFLEAKPKAKRTRKVKKEPFELPAGGDETAPVEAKKKRTRKPKEEPVYVIPDVERKSTTFRGRLGYACLNTILRSQKPSIFCSRTCRLDTLKTKGIEFAQDLGKQNAEDLIELIKWNEANNIRFLRVSSNLFPFASHPLHGYPLTQFAPLLARVGEVAASYNHRLTTHPGQFTQLGSPREEVVAASLRELAYHAEMLDLMNAGKDGVMIIHGGGVYEDKPATLLRLTESIRNLPSNIRDRLVLENDELCYSAEDLLPICEELDVPLVFDYHHDALYPSPSMQRGEIIRRANAIFQKRGIKPKQHLSEQRPGAESLMERRAHSDRCEALPDDLPDDMDLMIEAKDKEQAVLHLYRIYGLEEVNHKSLRPPTPPEEMTTETKGRKSSKRKSANGDTPKRKRTAKGSDSDILEEEEVQDTLNDTPLDAAQLSGNGATPPKPSPKKRKNAKAVDSDLSGKDGVTPKKRNRAKPAESAAAVKEAHDPATAAETAAEGSLPGKVTPKKKKRTKPAEPEDAEMEANDSASAAVIAEPENDAVTPKKRKRTVVTESETSEGEVSESNHMPAAEPSQMPEVNDKSPKRKGKKQKLALDK